jgi:serine/threonine-protein kinase
MGDYAEAATMFEKGTALRPEDPLMWGNLGEGYRWAPGLAAKAAEALDRAIELERRHLERDDKDGPGHALLAKWLALRGASREAVQQIRRALKLSPDDVDCMARAVTVYHLAGDDARALEWLEHALANGCTPAEFERNPEIERLRADPAFRRIVSSRTEAKPPRDGEDTNLKT